MVQRLNKQRQGRVWALGWLARLRCSRVAQNPVVAAQQNDTMARKRPLQTSSQAIMASHGGG
jgi:hypothetical protein